MECGNPVCGDVSVPIQTCGDKPIQRLNAVALALLISLCLVYNPISANRRFYICFATTSDSPFNDDIRNVEVWQYNTTTWNLVKNFTTSGDSESIDGSNPVNFQLCAKLNLTLAADNATARARCRVNMTISYNSGVSFIWNNIALNVTTTNTYNDTSFYYITYVGNWTSSFPVEGTSYNCSSIQQVYR